MIVSLVKRSPSAVFLCVWLGCAIAGILLPKGLSIVDFVEKWLADLRLATIGTTMQPRSDMVLFTITEETLARHPYRFPIDRGMLADSIERLNDAGVRAIGLDILFDQPTEADKDARLAAAVANSAAPVIVGWASEADALTEKQVAYLKQFLPDAIHAPSNLVKDATDGTVRWIYPGTDDGGDYRVAFAPALAQAAGIEPGREAVNLYFRRGPQGETAPFRIFPLHLLKDLPKSWFAGKIVMIGADLPNEDRHRTPFAALMGNDAGALPGVVIHAFAVAQLLEGAVFAPNNIVINLSVVAAASALGVGIALLGIGTIGKIALCCLTFVIMWSAGFGVFALSGVLIPLFAPSFTFAASISLSAAVIAQRYKLQKLRAEAMVQRRNQSLHKMVENSFDGIVITTFDGRIVSTNSSADFVMGWAPGVVIDSPITDHISQTAEIESHFLDLDEPSTALSSQGIAPLQIECLRSGGEPFTMELLVYTARVSFDHDETAAMGGERVSYIYTFRDVTTRRLAEEAREKALLESEAANRAKTEFLANMSHELRTPLNAIIGFSEIIKTEAFGPVGVPQYLEYIGDIHNSGSHLIEIINDILDMSKIDAGELKPNEEPCDFARIADTCLRLVADRAQKGGIKFVQTLSPSLPEILADQRMLKQILLNLLSNAVKFSPEGGNVTLNVALTSSGFVFSVTDTGCGIPADKMEIILEPFGQADMSLQREFEGTGLGLPLVKSMTELHGGSFELQSVEGEGTTATVSLPSDRVVTEQKIA